MNIEYNSFLGNIYVDSPVIRKVENEKSKADIGISSAIANSCADVFLEQLPHRTLEIVGSHVVEATVPSSNSLAQSYKTMAMIPAKKSTRTKW